MANISYPEKLTLPVKKFLSKKLLDLKRRRKNISSEDPFSDASRVTDNAAPDIEADEQYGHARAMAIKSNISRVSIQVKKALARIKIGKYGICEKCGKMIDTDRLLIYPEATLCASDAKKK